MKILMINKFLYPRGGDAISTLATGRLLERHGHEVIFWGMKHPSNPPYPHGNLFVDNLDLNNAGGLRGQMAIAAKLLYSFEARNKMEALIRRIGKPDIVHVNNFAHQISPSILSVFKKNRIPVVMTMHDYKLVCAAYAMLSAGQVCDRCTGGAYFQCFNNRCVKNSRVKSLLNTLEMYLHHRVLNIYSGIQIFISPSVFMKTKVAAMGFKGTTVHLPNFIDAQAFRPEYGTKEVSAVYFGRVSAEKGIATLIEAVRGLPLTLKIIGDGPLRTSLQEKVKQEGITNVFFPGYMAGEALHDEVRRALFVVLPSEWNENNPLSVLEAFALGKPVIGARIGGIPELVRDHETGLTFISGNRNDLSDKIRHFLQAPDEAAAMGRRARGVVEREYSAGKFYERLMRLYNHSINNEDLL